MKVFVSGASSGIGLGLSELYISKGYQVYSCSRREPGNIAEQNFRSIDLSELDKIEENIHALIDGVDKFDLVILNAGIIGEIKDLSDSPMKDLKGVMDVNLWSNKVVLDSLFSKCKSIDQVVAISSGAAVNGNRGWSGYSISKAALNMLVKLYAAEKPTTHFNALAPGLVDTAMQDYLCAIDNEKFSSINKLKAARGTESMPGLKEFSRCFENVVQKLRATESGSFVDIRKLT